MLSLKIIPTSSTLHESHSFTCHVVFARLCNKERARPLFGMKSAALLLILSFLLSAFLHSLHSWRVCLCVWIRDFLMGRVACILHTRTAELPNKVTRILLCCCEGTSPADLFLTPSFSGGFFAPSLMINGTQRDA